MNAARAHLLGGAALLLLAVGLTFGHAVEGDFVWDDHSLILENNHIRSPGSVADVLTRSFWETSNPRNFANPVYARLYRPVVSFAYIAQFRLFGRQAFGYHVVSLVLHALVALFAWRLLALRLRPADDSGGRVARSLSRDGAWAAFAGALVFALHSSRAESVAWVSGSTELWMALWWFLGMLAWHAQPRAWAVPATGVAFVLAFFSKETAVVAPVLLALDAWLRGTFARDRRALATVAVILGAAFVFRVTVVPIGGGGLLPRSGEDVLRILSTLGHYMEHLAWPWSPSIQIGARHSDPVGALVFEPRSFAVAGMFLVALIGVGVAARRAPALRPVLGDVAWILLPLGPVLNVMDVGGHGLAAERFLYLPAFGFAALVARGVARGLAVGPPWRGIAASLAACFILGTAIISYAHVRHFRNDGALWIYELDRDPQNIYAINELASLAHLDGNPERAIDLLYHGYGIVRREGSQWTTLAFAGRLIGEVMGYTADADQATLKRIRDALFALEHGGTLALEVGPIRIAEQVDAEVRRAFLASVKYYRVPRITALIRTGDLPRAREELVGAYRLEPSTELLMLGVWVDARLGRWEDAARSVALAEQRLPGNGAVSAAKRSLARAKARAEAPVADDLARLRRDVEVDLILGGVTTARERVTAARATRLGDFDLAVLASQVEAADRQYDRARAILEEARALDAAPEAPWDNVIAGLEQARKDVRFMTRVWPAPAH